MKTVRPGPPVEVKTASSAGFCFGVRRAIQLAERTVQGTRGVRTMGPLIHNPQEVGRLSRRGIRPVKTVKGLRAGSTLILRTHGIPADTREALNAKRLRLVDATCPFVARALKVVQAQARGRATIVVVGEPRHPEVQALVSYAPGRCVVVQNPAEAARLTLRGPVRVVSQTTQSPANFAAVVRVLRRGTRDITAFNTICRATLDRQTSARRLARRVDLMIVVGGKNSGNTRRLAEICAAWSRTRHIETPSEIRSSWLRGARRVGVTAGASTPDWIIERVISTIKDLAKR